MQPGVGRKPYRARLRVDGEFSLDLQICYEYHIPHSEFLSWIPEDRAKAVAYFMEKSDRCQYCGTAPWEWDPDEGGNKFAYEAVEQLCQGCLRTASMQEVSGQKPGVTINLAKTNTVEHAKRQKRAKDQWLAEMDLRAEGDIPRQLQRERGIERGRKSVPAGDGASAGQH